MEEVGDDFPDGLFVVYEGFIASTNSNWQPHAPQARTLTNDIPINPTLFLTHTRRYEIPDSPLLECDYPLFQTNNDYLRPRIEHITQIIANSLRVKLNDV